MSEFVSYSSVVAAEKILKSAGAVRQQGCFWYINGDLVGYREEIDRDEDRIYFDHFVRKDLI